MIQLFMKRSGSPVIVPLNLPASHDAMTEAASQLDEASRAGKTEIVEIKSVIANLPSYLGGLDPDSRMQLAQLNQLSSIIAKMDSRERNIYAGALDGNSINDLNDMIRVAEQVSDYILIPNVNSDVTLGRYVAVAGQIQGDPRFPEAAWPYLDFAKIGAEYYAEHGGAYTYAGYVLRKQDDELVREKKSKIQLDLSSSQAQVSVCLPATKEELERVKRTLGIDCFAEAAVTKVLFSVPYMDEHIPTTGVCVEDANELAWAIEGMQCEDGELLKYLSVLSVEQPGTMQEALRCAMNLDDYERIPEDTYEYGQAVLRRIGADDELIDTIDGYMDFEKLGEDTMAEEGVRRTEFGLIRRCSSPFAEETQAMEMGGLSLMPRETDLLRVKLVAHTLLDVQIQETALSPVIVSHPFTSSGISALRNEDGSLSMVDLINNSDDCTRWRRKVGEQIDSAENVHQIFVLLNPPYYLTFIKFAASALSEKDLGQLLSTAWTQEECPNQDCNVSKRELVALFRSVPPEFLMDEEERAAHQALEDTVTVYRGVTPYNAKNISALSWTLDRKTADWFAHRFGEEGTVYEAQIRKEHILALFTGRNESEVIVDPRHLEQIMESPEPGFDMQMT